MIDENEATENEPLITVREEDPTLASVIRRLADTGWRAIPDGVLWWTLDGDATVLTLGKHNEAGIELNAIITLAPEKRKKGSAGRTLQALLAVLDELSIGCYLRVVSPKKWCGFRPRTENGLRKDSLRAWYKRLGFVPVPIEQHLNPVTGRPVANVGDVMYRAPPSIPPGQSPCLAVSQGVEAAPCVNGCRRTDMDGEQPHFDGRCSEQEIDNV